LFRFVADLQDSLVVLGPLMIAELAALRHGRAHIPGLEVPERADVSPMFRVLVTQEPRAPARVVALPSLPFRDRGDVHHGSFATEFGDGNFLPKEATRVLDAVFNRSATDAIFHEVRLLLRDAGDERRLRVCDHPNLVDVGRVDLRPGLFRIVLFRNRALAPLAGRKAHRSVSRSVFLRHSPLLRTEWSLLAYDEPRAFGRDTVTPPARPEESGPHFRDPRRDCPGASGRRVGPSLWRGRI